MIRSGRYGAHDAELQRGPPEPNCHLGQSGARVQKGSPRIDIASACATCSDASHYPGEMRVLALAVDNVWTHSAGALYEELDRSASKRDGCCAGWSCTTSAKRASWN